MRKFLAFLSSIRLAIALIAYLAVTGILATLVPQGQAPEFYLDAYPRLLAKLIVGSGFSSFFRSWLFILPAFLFFSNLSACTISRLLRELKKSGQRRHGPDLLHLGLMILVVASLLSFSGRKEGSVRLAPGDSVELPDGRLLRLERFEYLAYDDGRPREWRSEVTVLKSGKAEFEARPIRVNHPLRLGALSLYQVSHSTEKALIVGLAGAKGANGVAEGKSAAGMTFERSLLAGEEFEAEGASLFFLEPDAGAGKALVQFKEGGGEAAILQVGPGDRAGPFVVSALEDREFSGLEAVVDPGYGLVLAAFAIALLGIFLTFIQKLKDLHA